MFTAPSDLSDDAVADAFRRSWGMAVDAIEYAPVGFGSHHWRAVGTSGRWFLTVDDLDLRLSHPSDSRSTAHGRLVAALSTALSLRSSGCDFVVAPVPSRSGAVIESIGDRYVLAAYPHVEGATGPFGAYDNQADRFAVVDLLVRLHAVAGPVPADTADWSIPARERLQEAIGDTTGSWSTGPFGEPARTLLHQHREPLRRALAAYDAMVDAVRAVERDLVVTHGEPHRGNVVIAEDGPVLVDWDTALLAPPERDLWRLIDEDPDVRSRYERRAERPLDDTALGLYRLWWDLCEVALFVDDFRRTHQETEDTRIAWQGLQRHLDPARWAEVI